jgi:hypothetical protein
VRPSSFVITSLWKNIFISKISCPIDAPYPKTRNFKRADFPSSATLIKRRLTQWKLCAISDNLGPLSFEDVSMRRAPHPDLQSLLKSEEKRRIFLSVLERNGLSLEALNCNGNHLHPVDGGRRSKVVYDSSGTKTCRACPGGESNRIRSEQLSRAEPNNAAEASLPTLGVSRRSPYGVPAIPVAGRLGEQATACPKRVARCLGPVGPSIRS